jgi:hypothetical protein
MTTSKRKKKSSSLRITRPYAPQARTVAFHRNGSRTGSSLSSTTDAVVSKALLETQEKRHTESNDFSESMDIQLDSESLDDPANAEETGKSKQRKRTTGAVMEEWLPYRDTYLQEMLRHDGREGLQVTFCADCDNSGDFSCYDCAYRMHYCKDCLLNRHRLMPLHRIKVLNLSYQP